MEKRDGIRKGNYRLRIDKEKSSTGNCINQTIFSFFIRIANSSELFNYHVVTGFFQQNPDLPGPCREKALPCIR